LFFSTKNFINFLRFVVVFLVVLDEFYKNLIAVTLN
jgi:hypothetical protein